MRIMEIYMVNTSRLVQVSTDKPMLAGSIDCEFDSLVQVSLITNCRF